MKQTNEKRKYERYDTEVKIHFYVPYNLQTKINFEVKDPPLKESAKKKYEGVSKNISAGGLCFTSDQKLEQGNVLFLEIYLPQTKVPITMEGQVRWCAPSVPKSSGHHHQMYDTGIQASMVNGKPVEGSIYFDQAHQVIWSEVLEVVLGSFSKLHKKVY